MADTFTFLITFLLFSFINPIISVQPYDPKPCNTTAPLLLGSTYTCNTNAKTCNTYIVYRPQFNQTISAIATLFNANESELVSTTHSQVREVVVPIFCDCPDWSSRALVDYTNVDSYSYSDIACRVYQGMVKPFVLVQQNSHDDENQHETTLVKVPVKCACVNASHEGNGTRYLVTYPVMENDTLDLIALKFGVTRGSIEDVNGLDPYQSTIFEGTTLLVPTTGVPVLNLDIVVNNPSFQHSIPVNGISNGSGRRFSLSLIIVFVVIFTFGVLSFLVFLIRKYNHAEPPKVSVTRSEFKCFSPEFLDSMSKLKQSLTAFSVDELKLATQDFSKSSLIGKSVYKGRITGGILVAIQETNLIESANHVVDILTTINHFNVIKLEGCCYYMNKHYLVFEFAENGSLRDCLHDSRTRKQLTWSKRVKIAFELAEGLHYIHYCTKPTLVHRNINSGNVLITADWRVKISGFNRATPIVYAAGVNEDCPESMTVVEKEYLTPEYIDNGQASTKVDVHAYGVVLLELLSAKEATNGRKWLERVGFLADGEVAGGSLECLEKFKVFMDGDLEGGYGLGDAMCLAVLGKCCIQDDPQIRPNMNDVLKALSRLL